MDMAGNRSLTPEQRDLLRGNTHGRNKWAILYTVLIMTFMATLDSSIVNVAMPVMARELGVQMGDIQWVSGIYLVVSCAVMLVCGRLGDMLGKVRVFQTGVLLFTAGSALCSLSRALPALIAARVVQSLGCAAALANNQGIITEAFPASERGRSLGMLASFVALGTLCGPMLGGFITQVASWEWIFVINIPVGIFAFALGCRTLPREGARRAVPTAATVDAAGAVLVIGGIVLLFCSLMLMEQQVTPVLIALLALGAALLAVFVAHERRAPHPLMRLSVFKSLAFDINLGTLVTVFISFGAFNLIMPFYLQDARGFDVGFAGLVMTTYPLVNFVVGPLSGTVSDKIGCERPTMFGLAVFMAGIALVARLGMDDPVPAIVASLAVMSLGSSSFQSPNNSLIMGSAPADALGFVGSLSALTRNLGMSLGITAGSALLYGQMSVAAGRSVTGYVEGRPDIFLYGFRWVFAALLAVVAVGLALSVVRYVRSRRGSAD